MEIKYLQDKDLVTELIKFFEKIAISYGLNEPSLEFSAHLANILKKYYGWLTYEQLEDAFELNSIGILNEYLPKSGYSIDNKVKFTIPDITKIIKAYAGYKKIDRGEKNIHAEPPMAVKNGNINRWCDRLEEIFNIYMNKGKRSNITIPLFTCEVLALECEGLLDRRMINYRESRLNIKINKWVGKVSNSKNEDLIYQVFDEIIERGEVFAPYLMNYRNKYSHYF